MPHGTGTTLYVSIVPSGYGTHGPCAGICSFFWENERVPRVCGLERIFPKTPDELQRLVAAHLRALRNYPCFASCPIVLIIEPGAGAEAVHLSDYMQTTPGIFVHNRPADDCGIHVADPPTAQYLSTVRHLVDSHRADAHNPVISVHPSPSYDASRSFESVFHQQISFFTIGELTCDRNVGMINDAMYAALFLGMYWSRKDAGFDVSE